MAKQFEDHGIRFLHLVDLDGARSKHIVNYRVLEQIATKTDLIIDFGGGLKSDEDLRIAFESGASQITGGSVAVKDSKLFLLEINPRFPAWVYLAVGSGVNLPAAVVAMAMGEDPPEMPDFEIGKIFVRTSMDMITDLSKFEAITTLGRLIHTPKESAE